MIEDIFIFLFGLLSIEVIDEYEKAKRSKTMTKKIPDICPIFRKELNDVSK